MNSYQQTGFFNFTLVLAITAMVLVASLALLAATWFMVSHLLMPDLIVPTSWIGFVRV